MLLDFGGEPLLDLEVLRPFPIVTKLLRELAEKLRAWVLCLVDPMPEPGELVFRRDGLLDP